MGKLIDTKQALTILVAIVGAQLVAPMAKKLLNQGA